MEFNVDMLRMETKVKTTDFYYFMSCLSGNPSIEFYLGKGIKNYRYNYLISESNHHSTPYGDINDTYSFYLGFLHNSEKLNKFYHNLVIEYNPAKCNVSEGLLNLILKQYFSRLEFVNFKSCDICCDIFGIDMNSVTFYRNRKNNEMYIRSQSGETYYIGSRNSDGRVKIYDKAAEQKKDDKWIRWEATIKPDEVFTVAYLITDFEPLINEFFETNLPTVYFGDNGSIDLCPDILLKSAVYSIKKGYLKLNDFNGYYRRKISPVLSSTALYKISNDNMPDIIRTIVDYYRSYVFLLGLDGYKNKKDIIFSIVSAQSPPLEQLAL